MSDQNDPLGLFPATPTQDDPLGIFSGIPQPKPAPVSTLADIGTGAKLGIKQLARSGENMGRSLVGGFANLGNQAGIVDNSTQAAIDNSNQAAIDKNLKETQAEQQDQSVQPKTTAGKVAQGLVGMIPAIGIGMVNPIAGVAAFGAQGAWQSGENAINQGDSLANAQIKAVGQGALNTVFGEVVGGAGNKILSQVPVIGQLFEPSAADTIGSVAKRMVQGAGTMAAFKPAGTAIDYAADTATGEKNGKTYDWIPNAEDLATGALMVLPHAVLEYAGRNKAPTQSTQLADGTTALFHKSGSPFSSSSAAQSFIDANGLDGYEPGMVTEKSFNPESKTDKPLGYAVTPVKETPLLGLPNLPNETLYSFPDGSTGTQSQVEGYLKTIPEKNRENARASLLKNASVTEPEAEATPEAAPESAQPEAKYIPEATPNVSKPETIPEAITETKPEVDQPEVQEKTFEQAHAEQAKDALGDGGIGSAAAIGIDSGAIDPAKVIAPEDVKNQAKELDHGTTGQYITEAPTESSQVQGNDTRRSVDDGAVRGNSGQPTDGISGSTRLLRGSGEQNVPVRVPESTNDVKGEQNASKITSTTTLAQQSSGDKSIGSKERGGVEQVQQGITPARQSGTAEVGNQAQVDKSIATKPHAAIVTPVADDTLRLLVAALTKKRANAYQSEAGFQYEQALKKAKEVMNGKTVGDHKYFTKLADKIEKRDTGTSAAVRRIAEHIKGATGQPAVKQNIVVDTSISPKQEAHSKARSASQLANDARLKAQAKARRTVNTDTDSISMAVRKLGGINVTDDINGEAKDLKFKSSLSGQVWRKDGNGIGIDDMATALAERGYLNDKSVDGGKSELLDKLREDSFGNSQMSVHQNDDAHEAAFKAHMEAQQEAEEMKATGFDALSEQEQQDVLDLEHFISDKWGNLANNETYTKDDLNEIFGKQEIADSQSTANAKANESISTKSSNKTNTEESNSKQVENSDIYEVKIKSNGEIKTMFAVPTEETKSSGGGFGDELFSTRDEAEKHLQVTKQISAENEKYRAETDKQEKTKQELLNKKLADKRDIDGFGEELNALQLGKVRASLDKKIRINGTETSIKDAIRSMVEKGAEITTEEEDVIKPMSRRQYNRADNREQAAHEKLVKERGKKNVYYVDGYDLGKTAYDYANFLKGKKQEQESKPELKLTGQTEAEISATQSAVDAAEKKAEADKAKADDAAKKASEDEARKQRQGIAADNFTLSETEASSKDQKASDAKIADEQFAGQSDIFSHAKVSESKKPASKSDDITKQIEAAKTRLRNAPDDEKLSIETEINNLRKNAAEQLEIAGEKEIQTTVKKQITKEEIQSIADKHGEAYASGYAAKVRGFSSEPSDRWKTKKDKDSYRDGWGEANAYTATRPDNIADFGEKLEGAKKDLWKTYHKAMSDELPTDAKEITLSKNFPEPDYERLIDSGIDMHTLAAVKAMRDAIPSKPQKSYKLNVWATKVKTLRDFAQQLIDGKTKTENVVKAMRLGGLSELADKIDMYADLGYPAFKAAHDYTITGGWRDVSGNGRDHQFAVRKGFAHLGMFDTHQEAIDFLRNRLATAPEESKSTKLDLYKVSSTGDIVIGKKVASNKYIDLKTGFKTVAEARDYLKNNQADLLTLLEKKKEMPPIRRSTNDPRIGKDYRQGEDATSEKFASEFGFRGVQFGNYVEQTRRVKDLNNAYDALLDLAHIVNVPSRALSLDGSLGLAFGAQGKGGVDAAAAHYNPSLIVINLTKINGAGSLGHEWFHALDNFFARARGDNAGFLTNKPYERGAGVRPEVVKAYSDLMKGIKSSDFYERSVELDKTRSKDYWSNDEEMGARAFEAYLIGKAKEKGESSDYLANIVSEEDHAAYEKSSKDLGMGDEKPYAYPTKAEQEKLNPLFDNLFKTLQTKETDNRTILFSKTGSELYKLKQAAIKAQDDFKDADRRQEMRKMGATEYFEWADKSHEAIKSFAKEISNIPDDEFSIQGKTDDGRTLLLNKSSQKENHWQLTRFDSDGKPWGDTQYKTKLEAINEFLQEAKLDSVTDYDKKFSHGNGQTKNPHNADTLKAAIDTAFKGTKDFARSLLATGKFKIISSADIPEVLDGAKFSMESNPLRYGITKVRGGWTKDKIRKELKNSSMVTSGKLVQREIAKFDTANEFADNIFYHGTGGYVSKGLKPSIIRSEREAESNGGGGYGERYWGISVSKSKEIASRFTAQSKYGTVYPVILKKGAKVISMPKIHDASELEEHIVDLWNRGIDAVRIGDWNDKNSEQELTVLNPNAIFKYDASESFKVFQKQKFAPLTEAQIGKIYNDSVAIIPHLESIRSLSKEERDAAILEIPDIKFSSDGRILAFVKDGKTYFVADNISKTDDNVKGLLMHELGVHALTLGKSDPEFQGILKNMETMRNMGDKRVVDAFNRVPADTIPEHVSEEAIGYLVEKNPNIPIVQKIVSYLRSAIRSFANSMTGMDKLNWVQWASKLTADDIIHMATEATRNAPYALHDDVYAHDARVFNEQFGSKAKQSAPQARFYSQLRKVFRDAPEKIFNTGAQVKLWLDANAGKNQVKKDEIYWSGIKDWLDMQGKVSKADVLDYLDNNGIQVKEVMLGDNNRINKDSKYAIPEVLKLAEENQGTSEKELVLAIENDSDAYHAIMKKFPDLTENEDWAEIVAKDISGGTGNAIDTKFGSYVLPSGENYRELLLTLPENNQFSQKDRLEMETLARRMNNDVNFSETDKKRYNELNQKSAQRIDNNFKSAHFYQPNILAHIRFNERTDADGKKVMFLEELQSDWGQKGKKDGFEKQVPNDEYDNLSTEFGELKDSRKKILKEMEVLSDNEIDKFKQLQDEEKKNADRLEVVSTRLGQINDIKSLNSRSVPNAPFVTDTKAWTALALKHAIAYAAENGFDRVAWTNGEQQAARYDLSKQVKQITVKKLSDGKFALKAYGLNDSRIMTETVNSIDELADHIGKDATNKAKEQIDETGEADLRGLDLKVGGEGMKAYYDNIVPQVANDILKRVGGNKVESVKMDAVKPVKENGTQQGFDITPEMRAKILNEGQPLFSKASDAADKLKELTDRAKDHDIIMGVNEAIDGLKRAVMPQYRTPEAREVSRQIIEGMGVKEMQSIRFRAALNDAIKDSKKATTLAGKARDLIEKGLTVAADRMFIGKPAEYNYAFMQAMDVGDKAYFEQHTELKGMADAIQKMYSEKAREIQNLHTGAMSFIRENYFPHIWDREPEADKQRQIYSTLAKRPLEGKKSFLKQRVFEDVQAGLDMGFKPISDNPLDLVALKMEEMDKYILAHKTLQAMEDTPAVSLIGAGDKTPTGYTEINGRFGFIDRDIGNGVQKLRYVARDDVAQVINNYLSPSLYHNKYVGKPFTAYMGAANTLNQFQLGVFSAFHAGFTSMEAVISHAAIGVKALTAGDFEGAAHYFGTAPLAWINNPKMGDKIIQEMMRKGAHPEMAQIIDGLQLAGFKWQMDNRFRTDATKKMLEAWNNGENTKAGIYSIGSMVEQTARPILEWLVPRQKFGVFGEMYNKWIQDNPNASHEELRNSAQQIWNRVDSRLGQVVYDRMFMHNVTKNFAQMLIRAPGWTGGTILEVGGGIKDLAKYAKDVAAGKKPTSISDRSAYTLSMLAITAIANATLTALFTGDQPKDWRDLIAFRTGNLDEHGREERFMLPTYMKDVYAYANNPLTTLQHKTHPLLSLVSDIAKNRDYYGAEIRSEDDNVFTQLAESAGYAAKAFVPFWMKGVQKEQERGGNALSMAAPLIGVMPAPSDVNKTASEKLMSEYGADRVPQGARTQEELAKSDLQRKIYLAIRKGDREKAMEIYTQGKEDGILNVQDYLRTVRSAAKDPLLNSFNRLTYAQAKRVMAAANDDEKAQLRVPFLRKQIQERRKGRIIETD